MKPDVLGFFQFKNSLKFNYKVINRIYGIQAFFNGDISLREALSFILPGRLASNRPEIWKRIFSNYINEDGSVTLYGKKFTIPFNNYGDFAVLVQQVIIDDQYKVLRFGKKNWSVVDGGANMGVFSVFVANKFPDAMVYAFEPSSDTFTALKDNIALYPHVQAFKLGLGDTKTTRDFQIYDKSSTSDHFVSKEFSTSTSTVPVAITTLDDFANEHNLRKFDYIKLDTEGYEANILKGSTASIKDHAPVIVMSAYHKPNDKKELPELLLSIRPDYTCEFHSDNEDDLVCYVK